MSFSVAAARPLLRPVAPRSVHARLVLKNAAPRRCESTDAAAKARQAASEVTAKATQTLSRVSAAAGPALSKASASLAGFAGTLSRVGGPTGKVIAFVERQTPFVVYYSKVGIELSRLIFRNQKMSPPSLDVFQAYFQNAWKQLQNPSQFISSPAALLQQARSLSPAQLASGGVLAAELLGFFTVGEIIGRFKLIGYHGEVAHHH